MGNIVRLKRMDYLGMMNSEYYSQSSLSGQTTVRVGEYWNNTKLGTMYNNREEKKKIQKKLRKGILDFKKAICY